MKKIISVLLLSAFVFTSSAFAISALPGWTEIRTYNKNATMLERVPGFCYTIYRDSDCIYPIQTVWGNNLGVAAFKKIPPGTYYVKNILASGGFKPDPETHEFVIRSGRCTVLEYFSEPSDLYTESGPNIGKFKYSIKGTISGVAINNMMSNGKIMFCAEYGPGILTPTFLLVNKYSYSILNAKDVSIKCLFNKQTMTYKLGTEVCKDFMYMVTYDDDLEMWREVPFIKEGTTYNFSGSMKFSKIPAYMMNCRMAFTYGDKGDTVLAGQTIPLTLIGSNLTATFPYVYENRRGLAKVKVNVLTGKSSFTLTENDAIGVAAIYEE